jgi:hypothetical protein
MLEELRVNLKLLRLLELALELVLPNPLCFLGGGDLGGGTFDIEEF